MQRAHPETKSGRWRHATSLFFMSKPSHNKVLFNHRRHRPRNMSVRHKSYAPKSIATKPTCGNVNGGVLEDKEKSNRGVYEEIIKILHDDSWRRVPDEAILRNGDQIDVYQTFLVGASQMRQPLLITLIRGMQMKEVDRGTYSKQMRVQNMGWEITMKYNPNEHHALESVEVSNNFEIKDYVLQWTDYKPYGGWRDEKMFWIVPLQTIYSMRLLHPLG